MKVTKSQLERGVLLWTNPQIQVELHSKPIGEPKAERVELLREHTGSLAPWTTAETKAIQPVATSRDALNSPGTIQWLWADDEGIGVSVLEVNTKTKMRMAHVLGWGIFHRLVAFVPHLTWDEDVAFVYPNLCLRLTSTFSGDRIQRLAVPVSATDLGFVHGRPGIYEGRFIEIIAGEPRHGVSGPLASETEEAAQAASMAYSTWGAMVYLLGANALGSEIVLSASHVGHLDEGLMSEHHLEVRVVSSVASRLDAIEDMANRLAVEDAAAIHAALRWYERGRNSSDYRDQLLAFSHGVEAIIRDFGRRTGLESPVERAIKDPRILNALESMDREHPPQAMTTLRNRLLTTTPSLRDYLEHFRTQHDLPESFSQDSMKVNRLRNPAAHGSSRSVHRDDAFRAQTVLERAIGAFIRSPLSSYGESSAGEGSSGDAG